MQDIEFTVENRKLWMLQTRNGKRTAKAALKIAVDMVAEKLITQDEAILRLDPLSLDQLLHPTLDPKATKKIIAKGLPASPGAASGKVVFSADEAEHRANLKENVILVRIETSPEDIHGMIVARGILTARGGMTSHAAVVARGMGKCCVSGAGDLRINYAKKEFMAGGVTVKEGDIVTLNGSTGEVMLGQVATVEPNLSGDFTTVMHWADSVRTMKVRTNAETPTDAKAARGFGAEGIGLCRTEHMFFDAERIVSMREMIVAETKKAREAALAKLLPFQRNDFIEIFKIMDGLPVTIRLLDPPLHEFLPHSEAEMQQVADAAGLPLEAMKYRAAQLHEANPMLGHRGCRLGITYPEIYAMQARAIFEAAVAVQKSEIGNRKSDSPPSPPVNGGDSLLPSHTQQASHGQGVRSSTTGNSNKGSDEIGKESPPLAGGSGGNVAAGTGVRVLPEIMIPLVMTKRELAMMKQIIDEVAADVFKESGITIAYQVGTMIELPRAALRAGDIAEYAEFFSFGTNDLTQTTLGISRDDAANFIEQYKKHGVIETDPFVTLDQEGVGELIRIACERGRATNRELKLGICGEHGGDPASIQFCQSVGLHYVSCSPYRVPIARLAAAQAALKAKGN
jgi:phosphoenolpyruvate synthase/pyruvate phosphate dikinase